MQVKELEFQCATWAILSNQLQGRDDAVASMLRARKRRGDEKIKAFHQDKPGFLYTKVTKIIVDRNENEIDRPLHTFNETDTSRTVSCRLGDTQMEHEQKSLGDGLQRCKWLECWTFLLEIILISLGVGVLKMLLHFYTSFGVLFSDLDMVSKTFVADLPFHLGGRLLHGCLNAWQNFA